MDGFIPVVRVREQIVCCKSRLDEIAKALNAELEKPLHQRDPRLLTFLEFQRQKFAFSIATLYELFEVGGETGPPIAIQSEITRR